MGERRVRNAEVVGSSPMRSTTHKSGKIITYRCFVGQLGLPDIAKLTKLARLFRPRRAPALAPSI